MLLVDKYLDVDEDGERNVGDDEDSAERAQRPVVGRVGERIADVRNDPVPDADGSHHHHRRNDVLVQRMRRPSSSRGVRFVHNSAQCIIRVSESSDNRLGRKEAAILDPTEHDRLSR